MTLTYLVHTPVPVATLDLSVQPQVGSWCLKWLITKSISLQFVKNTAYMLLISSYTFRPQFVDC